MLIELQVRWKITKALFYWWLAGMLNPREFAERIKPILQEKK